MDAIRLRKTLAALGMSLLFTCGIFAVSLAHDLPPTGLGYSVELRHHLNTDPVRLGAYPLVFALEYEIGNIPSSAHPDLEEHRSSSFRRVEPAKAGSLSRVKAPKVSLQILESVLLI